VLAQIFFSGTHHLQLAQQDPPLGTFSPALWFGGQIISPLPP